MRNYNYNTNNNHVSTGGIGVTGLLGVAFVVLKLLGVIKWPWVWVLLPFWGGLALVILIFAAILIVETIKEKKQKRRLRK